MVLFHSSTAAALPFYIFTVLANIFSGFVLLSRRFGCNRLFSLSAGLLAVIGGWVSNALNIGGLDNLLFLSLFPFLVVRLELYRFGDKPGQPVWPSDRGLQCVLFVSGRSGNRGSHFPTGFFESVWSVIYRRGRVWRRYLISACLILVLISLYIQVFFTSLFGRIGVGMSRGIAGLFPGLLSPRFLPAMFGFGQEYPGTICLPHDVVLPTIMLSFHRSRRRNLDKAKEGPDCGLLDFDRHGHLAGIVAAVRLRTLQDSVHRLSDLDPVTFSRRHGRHKFCAEAGAAVCSNTWDDHLFQWGSCSENGAAGEDPTQARDTDEMVLRTRQVET